MQHHVTPRLLLVLALLLAPAIVPAQIVPENTDEPIREQLRERIRSEEEDHERHGLRDAWMESMHRCEPGLNWRAIDRENRRAIGVLRSAALRNRTPGPMQGVPDTVPGVISGTWMERGSRNMAGRIRHADVDLERGLVYAASDGGTIWRGTLEGEGWRSLNDTIRMPFLTILNVVPRPGGTRLMAMTERPAILYLSDDDGLSWHQNTRGLDMLLTTGASKKGVVLKDSSRTVYLLGAEYNPETSASASTLYRSTDGCDSFTHILHSALPMSIIDIWAPDDGGGDLFMLHRDTLSRLRPDGSRVVMGRVPYEPYTNAVHLRGSSAGGTLRLYALMERRDSVWWSISSDSGRTWRTAGALFRPLSHNGIAVSTVDPASAFLGGVNCYRSRDSARTFRTVSDWAEYYDNPEGRLHADIFGIHPFRDRDGSEFIVICTDGGIYISRDTLRTVRNISMQGLNVSQYYSTLTSWREPSHCHAGSQDQGYQRSTGTGPGPLDFVQVLSGDYGSLASSDSGRTVWANYPNFTLLVTENERGEPGPVRTVAIKGFPQHWIPPLVADPYQPLIAYLPASDENADGSYLWRIDARSYPITTTRLPFNFKTDNWRINTFGISPVEAWRWYVMLGDGKLFRSEDVGESWELVMDSSIMGVFYGPATILPSPVDPETVYIAGSGYSSPAVVVSTDGGRSFSSISDGLPNTLVSDLAADPQGRYLFAATDVGPFVYSMAHRQWYYLGGANAPEQVYMSVEYIPATRTVRFGTYGRGIWDFVADKGASVDPADAPHASSSIRVAVSPNPALSEAAFRFTMPEAGHAMFHVYDLSGQQVATLAGGYLEAGEHRLAWDLRSGTGLPVPSGSYTCVISSGGRIGFARLEVVR